jgi:hypothetical protein
MFVSGVTDCGRSCAHANLRNLAVRRNVRNPVPQSGRPTRPNDFFRAKLSGAERGAGHHEECGPARQDRRLGQLVAEPLDQVKQPRQSSGSAISLRKTRCPHLFMSAFFEYQKTG